MNCKLQHVWYKTLHAASLLCFALLCGIIITAWLLHPQAGSVGTVLDHSGSYINYVMLGRLEGSAERHSQFMTEMEVVLYMCPRTGWTPFMLCWDVILYEWPMNCRFFVVLGF